MGGLRGQAFWWISPVYPQAKVAYRRLKRGLSETLYTANESELTITLVNGAIISFRSAEKPDNLYGEDVYAAVLDEACLLYTSPSPRDRQKSRMPSSA